VKTLSDAAEDMGKVLHALDAARRWALILRGVILDHFRPFGDPAALDLHLREIDVARDIIQGQIDSWEGRG